MGEERERAEVMGRGWDWGVGKDRTKEKNRTTKICHHMSCDGMLGTYGRPHKKEKERSG